jgi:hypothetical protein
MWTFMNAFFEISGLNIYLQIAVTVISIAVHLFATRGKSERKQRLRSSQSTPLASPVGFRSQAVFLGISSTRMKWLDPLAGR